MTLNQHTIFSNVFTVFYNLLNKNVVDPSSRNKQWIFSSFPEEDISADKIKYPIIIIEPPDMAWEQFTQTKSKNLIEVRFSAFSTRMDQADSILNQINATMDHFKWDLKVDEGIDFLNLASTDTDFTLRGGTRAHERLATYTMENIFRSGLAKLSRSNTINSNVVIASA